MEYTGEEWRSALKAGDAVAVVINYGNAYEINKVERVTATQIVLPEGQKFSKGTGRRVGGGYSNDSLVQVTPEIVESVKRRRLVARLRNVKWTELPTAVMERVWAEVYSALNAAPSTEQE